MNLSEVANPKINLTLRVTGRRDDGYHDLESLVVFAEGGDQLSAEAADDLSLEITGPFADDLKKEDPSQNLVLRAAKALQAAGNTSKGAHLTLQKNLPIASGIGGGSADAAAALKLLNQLWGLKIGDEELADIGLALGADIPACLYGQPLLMRGIGDQLTPLLLNAPLHIILVNPRKAISTPEVFKALDWPENPNPGHPPFEGVEMTWQTLMEGTNDLQEPAIALAPVIHQVLEKLRVRPGCRIARMSGSGATCFGLFEDPKSLEEAVDFLKSQHPTWWVFPTAVQPT
ncbi:4-(cytidine 5'-diphospho)-2-C-methyl-D-erythritol kinase [Sneathiella limimaris]|uniref:4-(cytidine 5'-diphospho)-2-C-methyl-D-erythritol kinase n=1 Tax=Sneathiella limimaris TaxID=1964213 RepID=UPI001469EDBE|nr:4-(cytidine 5'-diphospho)-2-C-methyl-D-erythritol kinase [Sneathiella limimaris]